MRVFAAPFLAVLLWAGSQAARPQLTGVVQGIVVDVAGSSLPGAKVDLLSGTRVERTTLTGANGRFRFDRLALGSYQVRATLSGFKASTSAVTVKSDAPIPLRLTLDVGSVSESVAVSSQRKEMAAPAAELAAADARAPIGIRGMPQRLPRTPMNTEAYDRIVENGFRRTVERPALDVLDRRRHRVATRTCGGSSRAASAAPADAVRIEELVNYFRYDYPQPTSGDPVLGHDRSRRLPVERRRTGSRASGLQGRALERREDAAAQPGVPARRLGLDGRAEQAAAGEDGAALLVDSCGEKDRVAIVVYAGASGLVLPSTRGDRKSEIAAAIELLRPAARPTAAAGIQLAYDTAAAETSSRAAPTASSWHRRRFQRRRDEPGRAHAPDRREAQARRLPHRARLRHGQPQGLDDGEARRQGERQLRLHRHAARGAARCSSSEMGATLVTIAKDVKIQVEFNPATVGAYRLIGYENRLLAKRGLQRRQEGRRRDRRRAHGDGALRDRPAGRGDRSTPQSTT